jgi:hypothetical protein
MSISQIFKTQIPNNILFDLLNKICLKTDKNYVLNKDCFKKGILTEDIIHFIENCKQFYYASKQKYLNKKITYNSFTTILRQICNFNNIMYTSKIKYDKSTYTIVYYIYYNQ